MRKSTKKIWVWIIIIIAVLLVGIFIYKNFMAQKIVIPSYCDHESGQHVICDGKRAYFCDVGNKYSYSDCFYGCQVGCGAGCLSSDGACHQ